MINNLNDLKKFFNSNSLTSIEKIDVIKDLFKVFNVVKNHLKDGGLFLLDCFNPNIQYIVEGEKEQKEIAAYTTDDGREVLIKQKKVFCLLKQLRY